LKNLSNFQIITYNSQTSINDYMRVIDFFWSLGVYGQLSRPACMHREQLHPDLGDWWHGVTQGPGSGHLLLYVQACLFEGWY